MVKGKTSNVSDLRLFHKNTAFDNLCNHLSEKKDYVIGIFEVRILRSLMTEYPIMSRTLSTMQANIIIWYVIENT